jgi:hypothetical protein
MIGIGLIMLIFFTISAIARVLRGGRGAKAAARRIDVTPDI